MKIYFAGSIRGGRDDRNIYLNIIRLLNKYGTVLTEHIGNEDLSIMGEALASQAIYSRDMDWVNEADVVVAEVSTPSLGVGYEIARAEDSKKILCLFREQEGRRLSAMIDGNKKLVVKTYKTLENIEETLETFFKSL